MPGGCRLWRWNVFRHRLPVWRDGLVVSSHHRHWSASQVELKYSFLRWYLPPVGCRWVLMFDFRPRPSDPGDLEYTQTSLLSREVTLYDNQILQTSVLGYFWYFWMKFLLLFSSLLKISCGIQIIKTKKWLWKCAKIMLFVPQSFSSAFGRVLTSMLWPWLIPQPGLCCVFWCCSSWLLWLYDTGSPGTLYSFLNSMPSLCPWQTVQKIDTFYMLGWYFLTLKLSPLI